MDICKNKAKQQFDCKCALFNAIPILVTSLQVKWLQIYWYRMQRNVRNSPIERQIPPTGSWQFSRALLPRSVKNRQIPVQAGDFSRRVATEFTIRGQQQGCR